MLGTLVKGASRINPGCTLLVSSALRIRAVLLNPWGAAAAIPHLPLVPAILVIEFVYAIVGIVWLTQYYASCNDITAKSVTLGT